MRTSTIGDLAEAIHDGTGMIGKELEVATLLAASLYATLVGNDAAEKHFISRMKEIACQMGPV